MLSNWLSTDAVIQWWSSPNQIAIKRPYTAKDVVSLRDAFPETTATNAMARKLRDILEKHRKNRDICLTTSPLDLSSQQMMYEAGMETAYVSGGVASFTAVLDPSSDHADYTYDTVPNKTRLLQRAQLLNNRLARLKGSDPEACLLPLIADCDSGFGLYTTVMKVIKLFVQAGAAAVHIDDLFPGTKRFDGKDDEAWTIVSTAEILKRLTAARLQLDIMGSEMLLIYRADAHNASRITSSVDARDRPHILGSTVSQPRDYAVMPDSPSRAEWKTQACLKSLDEAFRDAAPELLDKFSRMTEGLNLAEAQRKATELLPNFYFSADAARNSQGHYAYRGTIEASIERALLAADRCEMLWPNASTYDTQHAEKFATGILQKLPTKWLGYNITGAFPPDGSRDQEVSEMNLRLAQQGYCWQFMPLGMFTTLGVAALKTAKGLLDRGTKYYLDEVSRPALHAQGEDSIEWWYKKPATLTDFASEIIGDCI